MQISSILYCQTERCTVKIAYPPNRSHRIHILHRLPSSIIIQTLNIPSKTLPTWYILPCNCTIFQIRDKYILIARKPHRLSARRFFPLWEEAKIRNRLKPKASAVESESPSALSKDPAEKRAAFQVPFGVLEGHVGRICHHPTS
ncbi:hypothetical protein NPIL_158481 [Nephila pilipes]|uniref:Uncharacterized protein n=1 Tax=Nephila pilipes TaxID=299642 RepID=A0A8X6IEB1_NEPPI|nr:hypothetical protein NPIL_158481 [Nephila pilipes]